MARWAADIGRNARNGRDARAWKSAKVQKRRPLWSESVIVRAAPAAQRARSGSARAGSNAALPSLSVNETAAA